MKLILHIWIETHVNIIGGVVKYEYTKLLNAKCIAEVSISINFECTKTINRSLFVTINWKGIPYMKIQTGINMLMVTIFEDFVLLFSRILFKCYAIFLEWKIYKFKSIEL